MQQPSTELVVALLLVWIVALGMQMQGPLSSVHLAIMVNPNDLDVTVVDSFRY
jgi:hypothetical protein